MSVEYLTQPSFGDLQPSRDAFTYVEKGMRFIGWMPPSRDHPKYWSYCAYAFLVTGLAGAYMPFAFFLSYFVNFSGFTPGDFLTSIQVAFNSACLGVKLILILPNLWRFEQLKQLLDILDRPCIQEGAGEVIHRCVARCNFIYMVYQAAYTSYTVLTCVSSFLTGSTPWGIYIPFVDSHSRRVERLRRGQSQSDDEEYAKLVNCIKDHKNILQFSNDIRPLVTGPIFAQFLSIGLSLGLAMVNLMFFSTIWTGMATFVFIMVLMIETFPFCFISELIADDCIDLTHAIFHSDWVSASKRYKATLAFFLHQTQQPIVFIAGGIFPICMRTNIEMAKLAFSVVTIVKQMNIVEKLK
ncbi:PREDICTED: odorant receptor 42b-like [Drosophila arizonae]|uniref:Odorant receptor n=1 Tax=Drosophila arizonae TaxID=7263 RepID=A0ABM1P0E1_DROAR|nr:PREDICTED: odorant receptor 42b-like [Drosophila arizonae]